MANFNYNCLMIGGRLTDKPKLQTTASGKKMCRFSVAVNSKAGEDTRTDYFTAVAWEQKAEFVSKFFDKGSSIFITGRVENYSWTDQMGITRYGIQIKVSEAHFVDKKCEMPGFGGIQTESAQFSGDGVSDLEDLKEEELPF